MPAPSRLQPSQPPHPTTTVDDDPGKDRSARWVRRVFLALVAAIIVAALFSLLGVRSRTATARSGGYTLSVGYAQVARAGLSVPLRIRIEHPGGFPTDQVTVTVTRSYLELFDVGGVQPQPSESTSTGSALVWRFDPPPGDVLVVVVDARVQPGRHWGRTGHVGVLVDGREAVGTAVRTWLSP